MYLNVYLLSIFMHMQQLQASVNKWLATEWQRKTEMTIKLFNNQKIRKRS